MKRLATIIAPVCLLALFATTVVCAQGAGGGNGSQFAQFREEHKFTFQLTQMVRKIGEIDKNPKYALKPAQAKKILSVIKPLRAKPKMTQEQAKTALKQLKAALTIDQLNAMARIKDRPGGRPGGPGGPGAPGMRPGGGAGAPGMGRPGGNGAGAQGARPRMDPNAMKNFNPFYKDPKAKPAPGVRGNQRTDVFFKSLETRAAKSASKSAKPKGK